MIGRDVARVARNITQNDPRVRVESVPFTPVRELEDLSRHPFAEQLRRRREDQDDLIEEMVEASARDAVGTTVNHDIRLNEITELFSKVLFNRLILAKDTIIPLISRIASRINAAISEETPETWEVVGIPFREIYDNPSLAKFLEDYPATLIREAYTLNGLSDRDENEIAQLINTGSTLLNELLVQLIAKHPSNWLCEIYAKYFQAGEQSKINTRFDPLQSFAMLDELIVVHVLARVLTVKEVIDAGITLSLDEYRTRLAEIIVATGSTINRCIDLILRTLKANVMIFNSCFNTKTIYVFQDVYDEYLNHGGSPDAVIGAVEKGVTEYPVEKLLEMTDELERVAEEAYQRQLNLISANFMPQIAKHLPLILQEEIGALPYDTLRLFVFPVDRGDKHAGDQLTEDQVSNWAVATASLLPRAGEGRDLANIARFLLVDCCLPHLKLTHYFTNLDRMTKEAEERGETLDPRTAIYFVVVDEITDAIIENNCIVPELGQA